MVESTMQDCSLTIPALLAHGRRVYATSEVLTYDGPGAIRTATFTEVGDRVGHPAVREAAVIGTPDEWCDERPLACVVLGPDMEVELLS